jgi:hypothetical protein
MKRTRTDEGAGRELCPEPVVREDAVEYARKIEEEVHLQLWSELTAEASKACRHINSRNVDVVPRP